MTKVHAEVVRLLQSHHAEIERRLKTVYLEQECLWIEKVANGEYGESANSVDDVTHDAVAEAYDNITMYLFSSPTNEDGAEPVYWFWESDLGQQLQAVNKWLKFADLINITTAAQILRGGTTKADLMYVNRLIKSEQMEVFVDPDEPNPVKNKRVLLSQVEALADKKARQDSTN